MVGDVQDRTRLFLLLLTILVRVPALFVGMSRSISAFASRGNDGYFQIAQNVIALRMIGFDSHHLMTRGPLFPLMITPGILLQLPILWILAVNLAASIGTCLLVFETCSLWWQSTAASSVATILVTVNPWLIWTVKNPAPTTTATFFTALGGYLFARVAFSNARKGKVFCLCLGGVCALAALDHPPLIALVVGYTVALLLILRRSRAMSAVLGMTLLWIGFAVCLAPYAYRNFGITRRFVPITDSGGFSYFMERGYINLRFIRLAITGTLVNSLPVFTSACQNSMKSSTPSMTISILYCREWRRGMLKLNCCNTRYICFAERS